MVQNLSPNTDLNHDAIIVAPGVAPCGCIITAIAGNGMASGNESSIALTIASLTSPAAQAHFEKHQTGKADLYLFPEHGNPEHYLRVSGQTTLGKRGTVIVNCTSAHSPASPPSRQHLRLDRALLESGVHILSNPSALASLKHLYQQHVMRLVNNLLSHFIDGAHANIDRQLEQVAEIREINRLKDLRLIFSSKRSNLINHFLSKFKVINEPLNPENAKSLKPSELALLQQPDFEDWLELQALASNITSANTLFVLNQLLNQLTSHDISDATNPISPRCLCHCLRYALDRLGIEQSDRQPLYLAFESSLLGVWIPATDSLIQDLFRGGLHALNLINLPPNWSQRDSGKVAEDTSGADKHRGELPDKQRDIASARGDVRGTPSGTRSHSISQMMSLDRGGDLIRDGWPATNPKLSECLKPRRSDLAQSLKQRNPSMQAAIRSLADSDAALAETLDDSAWDKADLVDRLFTPLEQQTGLTESLRDQLGQLRLPVFEMLLKAPDFLDQENHIAREIVNDLMRLCLAERSSSRNLEQTVTAIIDELTRAEEPGEELYHTIGTKLKSLVARQDRSFLRNAERIAETLDGKQRLKDAQIAVRKRLNTMLGSSEVPVAVLDLLESGWEQLIVLASLREGPDSQACTTLLSVIEQIRLWLAPGEISDELAFERELESDALLRLVERELQTLGEVSRVRAVVTSLADQLLHQKEIETTFLESYPPGLQAVPTPEPEIAADERWARRARQIQIGDWVEITLDNGEKRRMRLVWGGKDVFRFVFLSPRGLGEISYDFPKFVTKLAAGEVWLVNQGDVPFVDQGLFDVLQDVYRKLNIEATHDPLTGCLLRHDFEKRLSQTLETLSEGKRCTLIALDIDDFNVINASYGTKAGDVLLKRFGAMLQEQCAALPLEAPVGRLGGNEFALLLYPMASEDSQKVAERIHKAFQAEPFHHDDSEFTSTLSVSVCPVEGQGNTAGRLLSRASNSLKSVKRLGGNRVELFESENHQGAEKGIAWISQIDRSIRDGSLYLRAQKIAALEEQEGEESGERYELLLGLTDASGREISPQNYIEAAEQFRRSSRVDLWVVDEALGWMTRNPSVMTGIHTLNVNLSGSSLNDDTFLYELEHRLKRHLDLTPKLCFEVTETSAVASLHYAADFMGEMKQMHCRFALDDFGTGLASYAYLQRLPVDFVKIDGVFVKDMANNRTNFALVKSINELSHFLSMQTIAEYVEDLETMNILRNMGVDFAQGYGIAKPRRLDQLTTPTS